MRCHALFALALVGTWSLSALSGIADDADRCGNATGREGQEDGDRCPSMHVIFVRTVLPFRLGPATSRRHFSLETEDHPLPVNTRKPGYLAIFDTTPDGSLSMSSATGGAPDAARVWPERPRLIPDPHNPYEGFAIRIAQPRGKGVIVAGVE
jgi:hypothetical protein